MALDVKIIINLIKPIGVVGFGYPLVLEENATEEKAFVHVTDLEDLVEAGYAADSNMYKVVELMFKQAHTPKKIAVCSITTAAADWLSQEANMSKDWRQLVVISATEAATDVASIMPIIEAQEVYPKMYYANLPYEDETKFEVEEIKKTVLFYYTPTEDIPSPVAALVGEVAGLEIGSYTLNNLVVQGIDGMDLNEDAIKSLHKRGGITFVVSAGDVVASEGITAGGYFVDNMDGNDWIKQQLEYKTQKVFNNNLKVPYTNAGIAMLESAAVEVMTDATNKGVIDEFTVTYALREDVADADRIARKYFGGNIAYAMQGAIHKIEITCDASF